MKKDAFHARRAGLVAALAAVTATAWAATEALQLAPSTTIPTVVIEEHERKAAEPLRTEDTLAPDEKVIEAGAVPATPAAAPVMPDRAAPVLERPAVAEPRITIEQRRLTLDERIQLDALERLAAARNISGKIGVETQGAVVTLTGYTVTAAQGQRAERIVRGVEGVREVDNRIRARIGGSV